LCDGCADLLISGDVFRFAAVAPREALWLKQPEQMGVDLIYFAAYVCAAYDPAQDD
jgi:hypothetical protein